jgi:hypothetical protein
MPEKPSLKRRVATAGGWHLAKRLIKPIPVVGTALTLGLAGREIRNKGVVGGGVSVGLDLIPFVGTAKGVVEIFTGDLIPNKKPKKGKRLPGKPKS